MGLVGETMRQQMQTDLKTAMASRDKPRVEVLRSALGALANAEALTPDDERVASGLYGDVARRELTDDHSVAVVVKGRDELLAAAREMRELGLEDDAVGLEHQADILGGYLPPAPDGGA